MLWLLFLAAPADAGNYITAVDTPVTLHMAGGWPRVFPAEDGWHLLWAQGGTYARVSMDENTLWAEDLHRTELTAGTVNHMLKDHSITTCPGGGYLHIASANVTAPNDSAYAYRYDDDFNLLSWSTLEEGVTSQAHNDMPVACSPNLKITVFGGQQGANVLSTFFMMDNNASMTSTTQLLNIPQTGGNSFLVEPETGNLLIVEIQDHSDEVDVTRLDTTTDPFTVVEVKSSQVLTGGERGGWPQAVLRIKDHYIMAFINQGTGGPGLLGDVMLAVFDFDWNLLETAQVTSSGAAMTPHLARKGTRLIVAYDEQVVPTVLEVTLSGPAFGLEDGGDTGLGWDTGEADTDADADSDVDADTGVDTGYLDEGIPPIKGCAACSSGTTRPGGPLWLLGVVGLAAARRRRRA